MRFIEGSELRALVPMPAAIDALEAAFRNHDHDTPPRAHVGFGDGELLFMPSSNPRVAGVKLVTVNPSNSERDLPLINGSYVMFDGATLQPIAVIDAAALTAIRTAGVSAVATRALAREDASRLVIFGAGAQAHAHLEAMTAVRPISELVVCSPSGSSSLVEAARAKGLSARAGSPEDVAAADIVCTCTTSSVPVFSGADLAPAAHVNAIGSYKKNAREVDSETVRRAGTIVVETAEVMGESGDLSVPLAEGVIDPADVSALAAILDGKQEAGSGITLFKSVGQAFEDLAVAEAALGALG